MKQIDELDITDNKKLVLSVGEFRREQRVDMRTYFKIKYRDEYIQTKKGINFNAEWLDDFLAMIEKLRDVQFE